MKGLVCLSTAAAPIYDCVSRLRECLVFWALIAAMTAHGADLPLARLWTLFPPGGSAGHTVLVTLTGADLDKAAQIRFSHPRITATLKAAGSPELSEAPQFQVTIGPEVPPGIYEARAVGRFGVSNPRAFAVSGWPEIVAGQTNLSPAQAFSIPLGTVVNGQAAAGAVSYFQFSAAHGQRVLIECLTKEIDSRMEPILFVCDGSGKELDRSRRKGLLDFTAPAQGEYLLKVHDSLFRGGGEFYYRLTASTGPHLDFIFPPAGMPGQRAKYVIYGRNLPGAAPAHERSVDQKPLERLEVEIEMPEQLLLGPSGLAGLPLRSASSGSRGFEYRLTTANGISNPILITAAWANPVLEVEPNNTPKLAQELTVPCEYEGQFYPVGDKDWITFAALKGEVYHLEIISQRLGLPTAPFLLIQRVHQNDRGEEQISNVQELYGAETNLGGVELNTATRDPAGRIEVKEDSRYRVQIRDLFNSGQSDPGRLYRLVIAKESPDFELLAAPLSPPQLDKDRREARVWTLFLRRGETLPVKVMVFRRGNFAGAVRLAMEGLPEELSCPNVTVEAGQSSATLLVTASDTTGAWTGPVKVTGSARVGSLDITRVARTGSVVWDVSDYNLEPIQTRLASEFYLSTSADELAPLSIMPQAEPRFEGRAPDKIRVPLKLAAKNELVGNLKLKAAGLPALDALKEIEVNSKTNAANLEFDLAQLKLPAGSYSFYVFAQGQTKYRRLASSELKAAEAAASAAQPAAKAEDRSFTAYSTVLSLKINPPPAATTTVAKGFNP